MNRIIASLILAPCAFAVDPDWPGFRGPASNPSAVNANLPGKWSKTSNIEWTAALPGLGWSSPIVAGRNIFVTTVTTDGKSKQPQAGTTYSNDYIAELTKQGLKDNEIMDRVNARDFELPSEVSLHYFLYSIDLDSGKTNWKREFYSGHPPGGRHRKNSFCSKPWSTTASASTYTLITSAFSPMISMATKSVGTPRLKNFRPSWISARARHRPLSCWPGNRRQR